LPGSEDLTLRFLPVDAATRTPRDGEAVLDLGSLSAAGAGLRGHALVVRQTIAVRLDSPSGRIVSARLEVFLTSEAPGCTVRVDGVVLSTAPRLLDPVHRVGATVLHTIEISVPPSAPEGVLLSDIEWLAESD
jgi:hypothetical protein